MAKGNNQDKLYKLYSFEIPVMYGNSHIVEQLKFIGNQIEKDKVTKKKTVTSLYQGMFSGGILRITNIDRDTGKGLENIAFLNYVGINKNYIPIYKS